MKHKKITVLIALLLILAFGANVLAQSTGLPDPGLTPDSPFYFLEKIAEGIGTFFTFGDLKKAERYTTLAAERLAEAKAVVEKGKPEAASIVLERYEDQLGMALTRAEKAKDKGKSIERVTEKIAEATGRHLIVLEGALEKVPEKAKEAIVKAKEVSAAGQKNALRALAGENPARATEINLKAAEARLNKAKAKTEEGEIEETEEAIKEFENQHKFGEEISQIAQGIGKDITTVEQLVGKATSIHLEILAEVYEKIPEQAKPAIEEAMTVSVKRHEQAVEVLKKKDALGVVPEEPPLPLGVPKEVKERVGKKVKKEIEEEKARETKCLGLGEEVNPSLGPEYSNLGKECCQELELIPVKQWFDENCNRKLIVGAGSVCTPCGNGVCDEKYENACNCPEDCSKVVGDCEKITESFKKGRCYFNVAIETKDSSLCKKTTDEAACYQQIAIETKDVSLCEEITKSTSKDGCYYFIAIETEDTSLCEKIVNNIHKTTCYAIVKNDSSICEEITDSFGKQICYTNFTERTKTEEENAKEIGCLKEGETYMPGDDKQCCAGLEAMTVTYGDGTVCTLPMGYVCTAFCGDGKCEGKYENACSCPEDCPKSEDEQVVDETLNWKIYRNEKYGYSFKYPQDWEFEEWSLMQNLGGLDFATFQSDEDEFSVEIWDFSFYSYDQLTEPPPGGIDPDTINKKEIIIDDQPAIKLSYVAVGDGGSGARRIREVFIQKNQLLYKIRSTDSEKCDQILSTFKFIK